MVSGRSDIVGRLKAALPTGWFPDSSPTLDSLLTGLGASWHWIHGLIDETSRQARIRTASDVWLDLIAIDFFGTNLRRYARESDSGYRRRILSGLLRDRTTRAGVRQALADLTGRNPKIFEPGRCADTGGYGVAPGTTGGLGYNLIGGWGNLQLPYQCFITAYRPINAGISMVSGWNCPGGGYAIGAIEYANIDLMEDRISDAEILAAVSASLPVATIAWTRITD